MRPLVVLLLVLAALGALLFALTSLSDSGRNAGETRGGVEPVRTEEPGVKVELVSPAQKEAAATPAPVEGNRQASVSAPETHGQRVAFGAIAGVVVNEAQEPVPEATISLLNTRPSSLGDDLLAIRGEEAPRPLAKTVTDETGSFRFDGLDPRKDWSFTVTHERYLTYSPELVVAVPEGGVWEERVILQQGVTLEGFVRDARTSQTIPGAQLVIESPFFEQYRRKSPGRLEAVTDANGAFLFTNVGASFGQNRQLRVTAPGYATQVHSNFMMAAVAESPTRFKNVQPEPKLRGRKQDFELEPAKVIAGRVFDADRRGVPGVLVEALSQTGAIGCQALAKSGARGEFLLEGLAEGLYTLRVEATNYDASPLQRVEAGDTNVELELFELGAVRGRVVDSAGEPLSNFHVKARVANEVGEAYGSVVAQKAIKGASEGRFELKGVPEGSYVIEALADGYASSFSDTFTATQGLVTSDILVRMSRGGSMGGRVINSYDGSPVAGAEVETLDNDHADGQLWALFGALEPSATTKTKVYTDAEGRFRIDVMTPGLYQVQVRARGSSTQTVRDLRVIDGQHTEVPPLTLIKGAVVRGIVYGRGRQPQPGASVQLTPDGFGFEGHRQARTDGSGRFVIENALPGSYQLSATRPAQGGGNPFEAIADMKNSQVEVSIEDGRVYDFDLVLGE
jgi:protocatechuate 3,4-dioxygenase beta subunit